MKVMVVQSPVKKAQDKQRSFLKETDPPAALTGNWAGGGGLGGSDDFASGTIWFHKRWGYQVKDI